MAEGHSSEIYLHRELPRPVDDELALRLAEIFWALSDPTRLRIVSLLADTELCVGDLAAALDMSQSAVSHQLRTLRDMRLVRRRREGRQIFYTLDDEHVADLYHRGLDHVAHE
ncbi:MAG: metalloregulator ArsR/SmtB family transcription factor [Anaerolineae bacterium]|jgi:ArsR family transcriptional regulator